MKQTIRLNESELYRIVKESLNRILEEMQSNDIPNIIGNNHTSKTYERDGSKEFTHDELRKLVAILKETPIEEMWKPFDLGWCKVQRVEANQANGRSYLLSGPHDMTNPQDIYSDSGNGIIYLRIGRIPNTHWLDESGYTYMCWK